MLLASLAASALGAIVAWGEWLRRRHLGLPTKPYGTVAVCCAAATVLCVLTAAGLVWFYEWYYQKLVDAVGV